MVSRREWDELAVPLTTTITANSARRGFRGRLGAGDLLHNNNFTSTQHSFSNDLRNT